MLKRLPFNAIISIFAIFIFLFLNENANAQYLSQDDIREAFIENGKKESERKSELENYQREQAARKKANAPRFKKCKQMLPDIISSCASAGDIYQCIKIRGEPLGVRYDFATASLLERHDVKFFKCTE